MHFFSISSFCFPNGLHFLAIVGVDVKKNVIVTISSDKGLCGGINSTSVKTSKALHKLTSGISCMLMPYLCCYQRFVAIWNQTYSTVTGPDKEAVYVVLGEKAKAQMIRDSKKYIVVSITELQKNPLNYTQVSLFSLLTPCITGQIFFLFVYTYVHVFWRLILS